MKIRVIGEMVRVAFTAIWSNPLRSFLTILGNIVAVASIMTLVSLIEGINEEVTQIILTEVGADTFLIDRTGLVRSEEERRRRRGYPEISLSDLESINQFSNHIGAAIAQGQASGEVRYRNELLQRASVQGVSSEFASFPTFNVMRGRLITPSEITRKRNVAVLGSSAAERLFGTGDPLDRTITIEGVHFRVIGVSQEKGTMFGQSQDEFALIPLGAFQRLFGSRSDLTLMVRPTTPEVLDQAIDDATVALRIKRRLRPSEENNFGIFTADTVMDIYNQATGGIFFVLIGVVGLALVVAGIVIMNIMLMAVSERTREIGLRKALGARRRDILWQVLSESVILSLSGGVLGALIGFGAAIMIDNYAPVPAVVHGWSVLLAISTTAFVGLFFGLYPASQAARLDPIEALGRGE